MSSYDISDLERQMKDSIDILEKKIEELESSLREIERRLDESLSQLKGLKSDI